MNADRRASRPSTDSCVLHQLRHLKGRGGADRQRKGIHRTALHRRPRRNRAPADPTVYPANKREGRTIQPHPLDRLAYMRIYHSDTNASPHWTYGSACRTITDTPPPRRPTHHPHPQPPGDDTERRYAGHGRRPAGSVSPRPSLWLGHTRERKTNPRTLAMPHLAHPCQQKTPHDFGFKRKAD